MKTFKVGKRGNEPNCWARYLNCIFRYEMKCMAESRPSRTQPVGIKKLSLVTLYRPSVAVLLGRNFRGTTALIVNHQRVNKKFHFGKIEPCQRKSHATCCLDHSHLENTFSYHMRAEHCLKKLYGLLWHESRRLTHVCAEARTGDRGNHMSVCEASGSECTRWHQGGDGRSCKNLGGKKQVCWMSIE